MRSSHPGMVSRGTNASLLTSCWPKPINTFSDAAGAVPPAMEVRIVASDVGVSAIAETSILMLACAAM